MTRHLAKLFIPALIVVQTGIVFGVVPSAAKPSVLTQEQVSAFQSKLSQARATQKNLGDRETCFNNYIDELRSRGRDREKALGESRQREQELIASLARLSEEQHQFAATFQDEQRKFDEKDRDYQSAAAEQREQDRRLHECKRALTIISFLCDIGDEAVRKLGWMRDVQAEMAGIQTRLTQAQNGLHDAQRRLTDNRNALAQAQAEASSNQNAIRDIEDELVRVRSTVSDLRATVQNYTLLLGDFASMLDEADDVDAGSPRARQIELLSSEVDDLSGRAPTVIELANSALPEGRRQNCAPH